MKKGILYVSAGLFHPGVKARSLLRKLLKADDSYAVDSISSIEDLKKLSGQNYDAVVIYLHRKKISEQALNALKDFISSGGGLIGVHSATASFKKYDDYFKILGGRFASHEEVVDFEIKQAEGEKNIFSTNETFAVHDEVYIHELSDDIDVHFYTEVDGERIPIVWTKYYGNGRVCYCEPGHCASSIENSSMRKILMDGLSWVMGG